MAANHTLGVPFANASGNTFRRTLALKRSATMKSRYRTKGPQKKDAHLQPKKLPSEKPDRRGARRNGLLKSACWMLRLEALDSSRQSLRT